MVCDVSSHLAVDIFRNDLSQERPSESRERMRGGGRGEGFSQWFAVRSMLRQMRSDSAKILRLLYVMYITLRHWQVEMMRQETMRDGCMRDHGCMRDNKWS